MAASGADGATRKLSWFAKLKFSLSRKKHRNKQPSLFQRIKLFWKPKSSGSISPNLEASANSRKRQLDNRPRSAHRIGGIDRRPSGVVIEEECSKLFNQYDKDHDQQLNAAEMPRFLEACAKDDGGLLSVLGCHLTGMTRAQLQARSKSPPAHSIGASEFKQSFATVHQAHAIFRQFDTDGDGQLNLLEYKKLLRAMGAATDLDRKSFSAQSRSDFKEIDSDGDKRVNFAEFWTYFQFLHRVDQTDPVAAVASEGEDAGSFGERSASFEERSLSSREADVKVGKRERRVNSMEDACKEGDVFAAQIFLERGDTVCVGGLPPIVIAAMAGHADLVAFLVQSRGLDPTLLESERTAVMVACHSGNKKRMQKIVKDLYTHATQRKLMLDALTTGNIDSARASMKDVYYKRMGSKKKYKETNVSENNRISVNSKAKLGLQLAVATKNKQIQKVRRLLNAKANINWVDASGSTALMHATWCGWLNIVDLLLERGGDVTISNRRRNTPLHFAAEKTHIEVVYSLLRCPGGMDCLSFENSIGKVPADLCVSPFLKEVLSQAGVVAQQEARRHMPNKDFRNTRVRATQKDGYIGKGDDWVTRACRDGDIKSLSHCIKTGMGSVHMQDAFGISPLMHAVYSGSLETVKYLITQHKVDITYHSNFRNNCLHYVYERIKNNKNSVEEQAKWLDILKFVSANGGEPLKKCKNMHGQIPKDFSIVHSGDVMKKSIIKTNVKWEKSHQV